MIVTTKKLFEAAYGKYAIGAYNINNLEQTMGLSAVVWTANHPLSSRLARAPVPIPTRKCSRA
jgi:fructose/tagatose bisphosphate aldolase